MYTNSTGEAFVRFDAEVVDVLLLREPEGRESLFVGDGEIFNSGISQNLTDLSLEALTSQGEATARAYTGPE